MLLADLKRWAIILSVPVMVTALAGCSAIVADLVILPFRIVGEAVEYAMEDHGSEDHGSEDGGSEDGGSEGTGELRITGYCHDPSKDVAYLLYSSSSHVGECGPGIRSISKAEYDDVVERQARAY